MSDPYAHLLQFLRVAATDEQRVAALKIFIDTDAGKAMDPADLAKKLSEQDAVMADRDAFTTLSLICKATERNRAARWHGEDESSSSGIRQGPNPFASAAQPSFGGSQHRHWQRDWTRQQVSAEADVKRQPYAKAEPMRRRGEAAVGPMDRLSQEERNDLLKPENKERLAKLQTEQAAWEAQHRPGTGMKCQPVRMAEITARVIIHDHSVMHEECDAPYRLSGTSFCTGKLAMATPLREGVKRLVDSFNDSLELVPELTRPPALAPDSVVLLAEGPNGLRMAFIGGAKSQEALSMGDAMLGSDSKLVGYLVDKQDAAELESDGRLKAFLRCKGIGNTPTKASRARQGGDGGGGGADNGEGRAGKGGPPKGKEPSTKVCANGWQLYAAGHRPGGMERNKPYNARLEGQQWRQMEMEALLPR